jgi:isopenicillin N synthase-like dioxygenase
VSSTQTIPVADLGDWHAGGARRADFIATVGGALADIGFFAVAHHGIPDPLTQRAYEAARRFYALPQATKDRYHRAGAKGQRGYTGFGTEHARDSHAPDLKEFWQVGRTGVPDTHPVHAPYGPNLWPDEIADFRPAMEELYQQLDALGGLLLEACALHVGEAPDTFRSMTTDSDTIIRVIYYPPLAAEGLGTSSEARPGASPRSRRQVASSAANSAQASSPGSVRSAAHEDINLITLLSGATSEGLELLRRDGSWLPVHTAFDTIVVDAGDMLQNVTNGLYKSTTHRVVNPPDATSDRYSMPCFIHPRKDADLTPLASCVARTGGTPCYPAITAGAYLDQRLREIGLG